MLLNSEQDYDNLNFHVKSLLTSLHAWLCVMLIIESVDSISRDGPDMPYM